MGTEAATHIGPDTERPEEPQRVQGSRIADALFTTTQQRVLGLLFGQPERSFFATELMKLAAVGRGAVQRELRRLTECGLVDVTRVGNQKHYQANPRSPIFDELRGLIVKTVGLAEPIRLALMAIEDRITLAILYGSVAKRTDHAGSDVDVLVVADDLTLEDLYAALATAEERLDRQINPTLYTSQEFDRRRAAGHPFLQRLLGGDHIVLVGEPVRD